MSTMLWKLTSGKDFYQMAVPRLVASETSRLDASSIFFTDASKGRAGTGFGVYHSGGPESSFFFLESQVECLLQRCRRFLWL
jgi:hypothetical protein